MAEVRSISVSTLRVGVGESIMKQVIFWGLLFGVEAASHMLFGGSWVIDIAAVAVIIVCVSSLVAKRSGYTADMSEMEVRDWVRDDLPADIRLWRLKRQLLAESMR